MLNKNAEYGLGDLAYLNIKDYLNTDGIMAYVWAMYNTQPVPDMEEVLVIVLNPRNLLQKADLFVIPEGEMIYDVSYRYLSPVESEV